MSKETICIAYTGEAVDTGKMNINDLAPALLAFRDLIDEANKVLNDDGSTVNVYVKSNFQKGSFEINLELARTLSEQIKMMFTTASEYHVADILTIIGFVPTVSGYSLKDVLEWLRGRKIKKAYRIDDRTIRLYVEEEKEDYIDISEGQLKLFRSRKVRKAFEGVVSPLRADGVDGFEVRDKENKTTTTIINKDMVDCYKEPDEEAPVTNEVTTRMFLKLSSVNFEKDLKWRFDNGDFKFYAAVEDEVFVNKVEEGKIAFTSGTSLEVDMITKQTIIKGNIKNDYIISRVYKINRPDEQIELDLHSD